MQNEIWKDIPNYEGLYQVSNLGNVLSKPNKLWIGNNLKLKDNKIKLLKPWISKNGYKIVKLYNKKLTKKILVHQLVAIAFLDHKPCGHNLVVDHINNDKLDNRVENLQIITTRDNIYKIQDNYTSKYKGVSYHKRSQKWMAYITIDKKRKHLGYYNHEYDAHIVVEEMLKQVKVINY